MENVEIANTLNEVADLLEIQGANPFRVRAYRNAARTVEGLTRSLSDMVAEEEDLTELSGIGEDISSYIEEMVRTGELSILQEIKEEVPGTLADLLRLDGVGPKKAQKLYNELDVESVDDLEAALDEGKVEELEGFGKKTVEKMRRSIEDFRKHAGRVMISEADQLVKPLLKHMEEAPGLQELTVAGSYRRRKETVGDIDILVVCDEPGPVMEHFTDYEAMKRVEAAGDTRGTIVLRSGLHVDLRIVPAESYGAAMHYFTGSKEHNVAVRKRGVEQGLKINEYGVFEVPDEKDADDTDPREGKRIAGRTEEEVYDAVGLVWTPPELRENRGEIASAEDDDLPDLVTLDDIQGDLQMHSTWSDGKNTIREMAEACGERGYAYLSITDHSQQVSVTGGLDEERLEEQWEEIEEVREELDGIHLFRSLEVDILKDGSLDLDEEHLEGLDIVLVSVHSYMDLSKKEQTERIVKAISHPAVHILAHPTGRRINRREPYDVDIEEVLQAAKENHVAVELNANPERLDLKDIHVQRAKDLGVPVVISTDAHSTNNLEYMRYGVDQARRGWLERKDVLNAKSVKDFQKWLEG